MPSIINSLFSCLGSRSKSVEPKLDNKKTQVQEPKGNIQKTEAVAKQALEPKVSFGDRLVNDYFSPFINKFRMPAFQGLNREISAKAAEDMKKNIQAQVTLGSKEFTLTSKDGAQISCMHIKVADFTQILAEKEGKYTSIKVPASGKNPEKMIQGICIPNKNAEKMLEALHRMKFNTGFETFVHDGKTFIVGDGDLNALKQSGLVGADHRSKKEISYFENEEKIAASAKTTALVFGGIESNKGGFGTTRQIFALMMMGYDVVTFDYRSTGKSTGVLSQEGIDMDAETIYNYLQNQGVKNKDLFLFCTCFGCGPGTRLRSKHEGIPIFLDSPYSSSRELAHQMIERDGKGFTNFRKLYFDMMGFDYNIPEELSRGTGHVAYALNLRDGVIPPEQDMKNLGVFREIKDKQDLLNLNKLFETHVGKNPNQIIKPILLNLGHGEGWFGRSTEKEGSFKHICKINGLQQRPVSFNNGKKTAPEKDGWLLMENPKFENLGLEQMIDFSKKTGLSSKGILQGFDKPFGFILEKPEMPISMQATAHKIDQMKAGTHFRFPEAFYTTAIATGA